MKFFIAAFLLATSGFALCYDQIKFENAIKNIKSEDGPEVSGEMSDIEFIFSCMQEDWASVKGHLPKMTLTQQEAILAIAMNKMNDVEYLKFTTEIIDEIVRGNIKEYLVCHSILMPNESKGYFPALNYKEPMLVNSLTNLNDVLRDQNKIDISNYIESILNGDALEGAENYYKMARIPIAPSVEQLRKVGKKNRWDWTAADATAINSSANSYGNSPESWSMQGAWQWLIVVAGVVILGGMGVAIHRTYGNSKKDTDY